TAQCESRHADYAAQDMHAQGRGYYSIASSGHEGNAAVAQALRPTDPALLHYRSGGFYCARAHQLDSSPDDHDDHDDHDDSARVEPVRDILLGVAAAAAEPISGGRHKVFGNAGLSIIPQ